MSLAERKKSRRSMILLIAVFAVPVILAKLALTFHWFDYGVTNKGVLVTDELTLTTLALNESLPAKSWYIIYANLEPCEKHCEEVMHSVMNTYTALGREMPRVKPVLMTDTSLNNQISSTYSAIKLISLPPATSHYLKNSQVLIVDPLGNVVLTHTPPESLKELPFFGKEILVDMKKLLKYSRVG